MKPTRCFVAIGLSDDVREVLGEARSTLEVAAPAWRGEKWVPAENLHITLKFLGDLDDDALARMRASLAAELIDAARCTLALRGLRAVPNARRCSMVWACLEDVDGGCTRLAGRVEHATVTVGADPAIKPFAPHVTLVRARRPKRLEAVALSSANDRLGERAGFMSVPRVMLFSSTLTNASPVYEIIESWALSGGQNGSV